MSKRSLWVIEMLCSYRRCTRWEPTVDASLTRGDARTKIQKWRVGNPPREFRIRRYEAKP